MSYFLYYIRAFWSCQSSLSFPALIHHFDCFSTCAVLLEATNQPGTVALVCSSYKLPFIHLQTQSSQPCLWCLAEVFSVCVCNWLEWALLAYYTHFLYNSLSWCGLIWKAQELCLCFAVHVFCFLKLQPAVSILPAMELFLILGK